MPDYSRANPSPRYQEMGELYRQMHTEGDTHNAIPAAETFQGISLAPFINSIGGLIQRFGAKTYLDYGSGKGEGYEKAEARAPDGTIVRGLQKIWGLEQITLYDPGYAPYSAFPTGKFDGVVCTDVLEHCPEEDMEWILEELFGFANKFLMVSIACYPAKKILPNGENAHITQKSPGWWLDLLDKIGQRHEGVYLAGAIITKERKTIGIER